MAQRRFTVKDDLMLLREVITLNPFAGGRGKWEEVVTNLNSFSDTEGSFNIKSCQARVRALKLAFSQKTVESLKASGTAEEIGEREHLLQELTDILEENAAAEESQRQSKKKEEAEKEEKGLKVREAAMMSQKRKAETADENDSQPSTSDQPSTSGQPSTAKRRRLSGPNFDDYFNLRRKQQELDAQRLQQEDQRIQMENQRLRQEAQRLEQERAGDERMFALISKLIEKK